MPGGFSDLEQSILRACEPGALVDAAWPDLTGDVRIVAAGKAAGAMARAAARRLPQATGLVLGPAGTLDDLGRLQAREVDHPLATERNVAAAMEVEALACEADDQLLLLLSGGSSAHLTLPAAGVPLASLRSVTDQLMRAGATIDELNGVRKHCERLKGGRLAELAAPARVTALVLSDVVGDRPDVIGSGPVSADPTTFADAIATLQRHGVRDDAVDAHLRRGARGETPETPKRVDGVTYEIVGSRRTAARAAERWLESRGFDVEVRTDVTGEAAEVGRRLGALAKRAAGRRAWVWAGETTVSGVAAGAMGGPVQEAALACAAIIADQPGAVMLALATDGADGPTPAAGAWVDGRTEGRLRERGASIEDALASHASHAALGSIGALIETGPTGTNVNDVYVLMTGVSETERLQ